MRLLEDIPRHRSFDMTCFKTTPRLDVLIGVRKSLALVTNHSFAWLILRSSVATSTLGGVHRLD